MSKENKVFNLLDYLFTGLMENKAVLDKIGLVSAVESRDPFMGWFIRIDGLNGLFLLKFERVKSVDNKYEQCVFNVKYFPSKEEYGFKSFSEQEQGLRGDDNCFDEEGNPLEQCYLNMPDYFFNVGYISIFYCEDKEFCYICSSSQDKLLFLHDEEKSYKDKTLVRSVEGWKYTWELFNMFVLGFSYMSRVAPVFIKAVNHPGHVVNVVRGHASEETDESVTIYQTGAAFLADVENQVDTLKCLREMSSRFDMIPIKGNYREFVFQKPTQEPFPYVNNDWWRASSWRFD